MNLDGSYFFHCFISINKNGGIFLIPPFKFITVQKFHHILPVSPYQPHQHQFEMPL